LPVSLRTYLSLDESKEETLEAHLLAGGDAALQAVSDYLIWCSTGREANGWWNNSERLVKLIRRFPGAGAEHILNALLSQSSQIWEYQTQVKAVAEAELHAIAEAETLPKSEPLEMQSPPSPQLQGAPHFPEGFAEVIFRSDTLNRRLEVNRDGVHIDGVTIPYSQICRVEWFPIEQTAPIRGGWLKLVTLDNPECPELIGEDFRMPGSESLRVYGNDNCFLYNALSAQDAERNNARVREIKALIERIVGD
jgi:hypothetical protein